MGIAGSAGNTQDAVRTMVGIMKLHGFEMAICNWNNWPAHLSAASALLCQLLDSSCQEGVVDVRSRYDAVIDRLDPTLWVSSPQAVEIQNADQIAFRFCSALLVFNDIIKSTVTQHPPRLYEYHRGLLGDLDDAGVGKAALDLENVIGCRNQVVVAVAEIAALNAWKQECLRADNLNVMELTHRASRIKQSVHHHLTVLESDLAAVLDTDGGFLDQFSQPHFQQTHTTKEQSFIISLVWAHAAVLYLLVTVSGLQTASTEGQNHVSHVIELLTHRMSHPALLRLVCWPFCLAGCLAEPAQEAVFRGLASPLQPPVFFGTVHKALEIMEDVWRDRRSTDKALASYFKSRDDLILLV